MSPGASQRWISPGIPQDMQRGDIWWAEHPDAGRRPHLILTRDPAITVLNNVVVVPATTKIRKIRSVVILDEDDGMPQRCALTLDRVSNISKSLITTRITSLGPDRMHQVCAALNYALGC